MSKPRAPIVNGAARRKMKGPMSELIGPRIATSRFSGTSTARISKDRRRRSPSTSRW
jgi:hypothetical protein